MNTTKQAISFPDMDKFEKEIDEWWDSVLDGTWEPEPELVEFSKRLIDYRDQQENGEEVPLSVGKEIGGFFDEIVLKKLKESLEEEVTMKPLDNNLLCEEPLKEVGVLVTEMTIKLKVKKLVPEAIIPEYKTEGAACFDICSVEEVTIKYDSIRYSRTHLFSTGLAFEIPEGHVLKVYSRSGHGVKNRVRLGNCVGIIDSDYRGELKIPLTCDEGGSLEVKVGDRIAQGMLVPIPKVTLKEVEELSPTERGDKGFGSTGTS